MLLQGASKVKCDPFYCSFDNICAYMFRGHFGVKIKGNLRRWNPISRKHYRESCWNGKIMWYMFKKPTDDLKVTPDNFIELLHKKEKNDAPGKARVLDRPPVAPLSMQYSTGVDSLDELPFNDGPPVDWNYLTTQTLENSSWRAYVKRTLEGMIDGVRNFNEAFPNQAMARTIDPIWLALLRRINRIDLEIATTGRISDTGLYTYKIVPIPVEVDTETSESSEGVDLDVALINDSDQNDASVSEDVAGMPSIIEADTIDFGPENQPNDTKIEDSIDPDEPGDVVINVPVADNSIVSEAQSSNAAGARDEEALENIIEILPDLQIGIVIKRWL